MVAILVKKMIESKQAAANSAFAIGGVSCSSESFEVAESSALRINLCAINPAHRQSANRYTQLLRFD